MLTNTKVVKIKEFFGLVAFAFILTLTSCSGDPRNDFHTGDIPDQSSLRRFDQDMLSLDTAMLSKEVAGLQQKYPRFFPFYTRDIMKWPEDKVEDNLRILNTNAIVKDLMDTVNLVFGDFEDQEEALDEAFKRFHHHFPKAPVPQVVTTITEFSYPTATDDSLLVLSLELFLGQDYPYYPGFGLPDYKIRRMNKAHLPVFALNAWYDEHLSGLPRGKRLLDAMVAEGKRLYFLDLMFPEMADSLKTYWTPDQLKWLEQNEGQVWTFYIDKKFLYSTDAIEYSNLLADAPFTSAPDVPTESAPRIAAYTGWRMVRDYMKENPEMTLQELMFNPNADEILRVSGYRPD